jgi:LL-diaminopimelate aminotransferase
VPLPAARLNNLPPYPFALLTQRVRDLTAQGYDVINLDIGSPDMPPPDYVVEALNRAARDPQMHGYAGYKGTTEFREAVADYYFKRFGVQVNPEREVLPLLGSKEGIVNLTLAYLDRGDRALMPDISYPAYSLGTIMAGGDVCWLPINPDNGFQLEPDTIPVELADTAKLLWINYPNNPTGATVDQAYYQRMVDFANAHDLILASDNPYCDVTFDGYIAGSALQADNAMNCTVEFISCSKSFNMAGWRLGAAVGSADAIRRLLQIKSNVDSGHFHAIYDAGIVALGQTPQSWIDERNAVYQRRRDMILHYLPDIGLTAQKPKGSLYVWGNVEGSGYADGAAYAEAALMEAHVSVAPGAVYGPGAGGYVRFSLGVPDHRLEEALHRLKTWYSSK